MLNRPWNCWRKKPHKAAEFPARVIVFPMTFIRRNFPAHTVWHKTAKTLFIRGGGLVPAAVIYFVLFAACGPVRGQTRVTLACNAAPLAGQWSCLRVRPSKKYLGRRLQVFLRDRRGGPIIGCRPLRENRGFLVPMVFASQQNLTPAGWPLEIKFSRPGMPGHWHEVHLKLPVSRTNVPQIAVVSGAGRQLTALRAAGIFPHAAVMPISRRQLSTAPALCLAGCRWLLMGRKSALGLGRNRMESILAVGVNMLYVGASPPTHGLSLHWQAWQTVGPELRHAPTLWRLYALPTPPVILRRLSHLRLPPLAAPRTWFWMAVLCGPLMLLIIGLSYLAAGPKRTFRSFILTFGVAAVMLGLLGFFYLRSTTHPQVAQFRWSNRCIESPLELRQTLCVYRDLRSGHIHSPAGGFSWPVAISASRWFALKGTIHIGRNSANARLTLAPGQAAATFRQTWRLKPHAMVLAPIAIGGRNFARHPLDPALQRNTVLFRHGTIRTIGPHSHAIDFGDWLARQSVGARANVRAWLATDFSPARQYLIQSRRHFTRAKPSAIQHRPIFQVVTVP